MKPRKPVAIETQTQIILELVAKVKANAALQSGVLDLKCPCGMVILPPTPVLSQSQRPSTRADEIANQTPSTRKTQSFRTHHWHHSERSICQRLSFPLAESQLARIMKYRRAVALALVGWYQMVAIRNEHITEETNGTGSSH